MRLGLWICIHKRFLLIPYYQKYKNECIVVEDSAVTKAGTATSAHTTIIGDTWGFV